VLVLNGVLMLACHLLRSVYRKAFSLLQEVALIGMLGYLSYLSGELLGLSGIVTLFCCAVAISHYALHNISAPARVTLVRSCQTLSYVSEGAIFIYVGMDTLDPLKWKVRLGFGSYCVNQRSFRGQSSISLIPLLPEMRSIMTWIKPEATGSRFLTSV